MNEKISSRQIILLITVSRVTIILTVMSTIYIPPANQDIWLIVILSFFYTILITRPIVFLTNRFKDLSTIGYMEKIFGKVIGKIIAGLYGGESQPQMLRSTSQRLCQRALILSTQGNRGDRCAGVANY